MPHSALPLEHLQAVSLHPVSELGSRSSAVLFGNLDSKLLAKSGQNFADGTEEPAVCAGHDGYRFVQDI